MTRHWKTHMTGETRKNINNYKQKGSRKFYSSQELQIHLKVRLVINIHVLKQMTKKLNVIFSIVKFVKYSNPKVTI